MSKLECSIMVCGMDNSTDILAKTGLPSAETIVAAAINDQVLMGIYYKYLGKYDVVMMDIRKAWKERRGEVLEVLRKNGMEHLEIDDETVGFFVKTPPYRRVPVPIYACFVLSEKGVVQRVVNVIDIGEGGEAIIAKGCSTLVPEGAHIAETILWARRGSRLTNIMLHNWMPDIRVSSKTNAYIGEGAAYSYYYVKLTPVHAIGLGSELVGDRKSVVEMHEASMAHTNSRITSMTKIRLTGEGSRALIDSRGVVYEKGLMNVYPVIRAEAPGTSGHIECQGLVMGRGEYKTHPSLETIVDDTTLTHEASIGKISGEQLFYLESRGLSEEEASKLIVLGFLSSTLKGLPRELRGYVESALKQFVGGGL